MLDDKRTEAEIKLRGYRNWLASLTEEQLAKHREWIEWVTSRKLLYQVFGEPSEEERPF